MERFTRKLVPALFALTLAVPAWASMDTAIKAYEGGKYDVAMKEFKTQAKHGKGQANGYIGVMYIKGHGVAKDPKAAAKWFQAGADLGDTQSLVNLARLYRMGLGVEQDFAKAFQLMNKAADQAA